MRNVRMQLALLRCLGVGPENHEVKKLRELAERDPGLMDAIESAKASSGEPRNAAEPKRLRMPYVHSEPLSEGKWK
jgi:hypothetical protein